jgi:hypothetical protein
MSKVTVYVGLDYHKDSIQVCVMNGPVSSTAAAIPRRFW